MADVYPAREITNLKRHSILSGFFYCSKDLTYNGITFISSGCRALTGYGPEDFLCADPIKLNALFEPLDYDEFRKKRKTELAAGRSWHHKFRIGLPTGELVWVIEESAAVLDNQGQVLQVEGLIKLWETEAAEIKDELKTAYFDAADNGLIVSVTDRHGIIKYANKLFCEHAGFELHEIIGKTHRILNSGFHPRGFFEDMWRTISSGNVWKGEIKNKSKDGETTWFATTISPVRDNDGGITGFLSVRSNITDKKNAEEKLDRARQRLKFINEHSPDLLITVDTQFRITYVNHTRSGFRYDQSVGASLLDYVAPEFREQFSSHLGMAIRGIPQDFEMPGFANDFHLVWYSVRISPITKKDTPDSLLIVSTNITDNKLAEEKTAESEKRFRTLFERNLAGVYRASLDNVVTECNDAFARMIGFESANEVLGKSASELYTNLSDRDFVEEVRTNLGVVSSHESFLELRNGKRVCVLENASMIMNPNGEPAFIEGTLIDITERKEAERALLNSKKHYKMLLQNMNDGFLVDDTEGNINFANSRCCEIFGYEMSELKDMNVKELFDPEFHEQLLERHSKRIAGELSSESMEYGGIQKNGTHIFLEVHVTPVLEDGVVVGTQSVLQDITERKKHALEFSKLAELNRKIIDSSDELFYVIEHDTAQRGNYRMVYISDKAYDFSGFTGEQILSHPGLWFSRLHPDDVQHVRDYTSRLYTSTTPLSCIYRINNIATGEFVWLYDFVKPILNSEGVLVELYGSMKNITELKNREEELEKTSRDLSNRYNELMQFNYIVSHNLRSPVANIMGMVSIFKMPEMTLEDKETCLDHINTAVNRMDYVIKDLNTILETRSALNEKKELVYLQRIIENLTATLHNQITDSGTTIHVQIANDADTIFTIKGYLESILYNLISNAIKYKSATKHPEIDLIVRRQRDQIIISVTDNGHGIDLKKFGKQIFGLYKRFNTEVEGKGLGLYMTRTQVETLGGKIMVQSTPGSGTTFTVNLPAE